MAEIKQLIREWAEKFVPVFNRIAEEKDMDFYTQSPLDRINSTVECMIVGINPGCGGTWQGHDKTTEEFLSGNKAWKDRFTSDGLPSKGWRPYLTGVHTFLNYSREMAPDGIDNDNKYVWTNVTPFSTRKANQIPNDLIQISVESLCELIGILCPDRIVLLGSNSYQYFERYAECYGKKDEICFANPFSDEIKIHIGRIEGIPCYCVSHPTGHWPVSHDFTTIVLNYLKEIDVVENGKAVNDLETIIKMVQNNETIQSLIK